MLPVRTAAWVTRWAFLVHMPTANSSPHKNSQPRWMSTLVAAATPLSAFLTRYNVESPGDEQLARSFCPKAKAMHIMPRMVNTGNSSRAALLRNTMSTT
jgi:hypothetical protein